MATPTNGLDPGPLFAARRPAHEAYLAQQLRESWHATPMPQTHVLDELFRNFRVPATYEQVSAQNKPMMYDNIGWMTRPMVRPPESAIDTLFRSEVLDPFVVYWRARCRAANSQSDTGHALASGSTFRIAPATFGGVDRPAPRDRRDGGSLGLPLYETDSLRGQRAAEAARVYGAPSVPVAVDVAPNYDV